MSSEFQEQIKNWVKIDNQIKEANEHLKSLRTERTSLTNNIHEYLEENDMKHTVVQISDGKLKFQRVKTTAPLTLRYVQDCLTACIEDKYQVDEIMEYIKSNRPEKFVDDIKRSYFQ
jgi:hypothetical protein